MPRFVGAPNNVDGQWIVRVFVGGDGGRCDWCGNRRVIQGVSGGADRAAASGSVSRGVELGCQTARGSWSVSLVERTRLLS